MKEDSQYCCVGDRDMKQDIEYLEHNVLGLKITDKDVVVFHIRPMSTFNM